jgi:hypothetical protein
MEQPLAKLFDEFSTEIDHGRPAGAVISVTTSQDVVLDIK